MHRAESGERRRDAISNVETRFGTEAIVTISPQNEWPEFQTQSLAQVSQITHFAEILQGGHALGG